MVSQELQKKERLKEKKLKIDHWRDKEPTRGDIRNTIHDFLFSDRTGLSPQYYSENDVKEKTEEVYKHIYRAYPELPSPFYGESYV